MGARFLPALLEADLDPVDFAVLLALRSARTLQIKMREGGGEKRRQQNRQHGVDPQGLGGL